MMIINFTFGVLLLVSIEVVTSCSRPPIVDVIDCTIETLAAYPVVPTVVLPGDDHRCSLAAQEIL